MEKTFTSKQIAEIIGGKLTGDDNIKLTYLGPPSLSDEEMLAVAFEEEHIRAIPKSKALCFLLPQGITVEGKSYIQVERPKLAMGTLLNLFYRPPEAPEGVHPTAVISPSAKLGKNISIGPGVVVGSNSEIGDNTRILANTVIGSSVKVGNDCLIYPCVYIGDRVQVGNKVIIHHSATIGADGYSYVTQEASNLETARESGEIGKTGRQEIIKIPSLGTAIINDDVEVGANTIIDRGTIQNTVIGRNTKIDNLVQIAHNVIVGESCFIVAQVGISGSAKIGNRCIFGGQVGVADHVEIGDDVMLMAKSGVSKDLPPKMVYGGIPAVPRKDYIRNIANIKAVTQVKERLKKLETELPEKETL
ncbi:MAG: UDP-3-O-(3-hydroxymyristoyl)glucosamine N-acyltransferase [Cyanobacteriota bacterium]